MKLIFLIIIKLLKLLEDIFRQENRLCTYELELWCWLCSSSLVNLLLYLEYSLHLYKPLV